MGRDPNIYQIMINGQPKKIADASRDELEAELMRAYDVFEHLENTFAPLGLLIGDFIEGRSKQVDAALPR